MTRTVKLAILDHRVHTARQNAQSLLSTDAWERPNTDEERASITDIVGDLELVECQIKRLRELAGA